MPFASDPIVKFPAPASPVLTHVPPSTWYSMRLITAPLVCTEDTVPTNSPFPPTTLTDALAALTSVVNEIIDPVVVPLEFVATIRK